MKNAILTGSALFLFCFGQALGLGGYCAWASEAGNSGADEGNNGRNQGEQGVAYEPEGSYYLGYSFLSQEDSLKAAENVYPRSSVIFGVDLLGAPLPHRYHFDVEYLNRYDFYGDIGYAYKDLLLFRNITLGTRHNLNHLYFQYPASASASFLDRNPGDDYFINYFNNSFSLRFKAPDFPFHTFIRHKNVAREGEIGENFLLGSIGSLVKTQQTRRIDWDSDALTLGANSHLGPVEIEYAHDRAEFDPGPGSILFDHYPESSVFSRPADTYAHNAVPETESSANTLKMHTSYTGGIVAAASLSNLSMQNNFSGAESETWKGAFDLSWALDPVLSFFFKFRHADMEPGNPDKVTVKGAANTLNYPVRKGIPSTRDSFIFSARYKPLSNFSILPAYDFTRHEREDLDEWMVLPEETDKHNFSLTVNATPLPELKLKGIIEYGRYDNPAYNIEPDSSGRLRLSGTYLPVPWLTAYVNYVLAVTQRDNLRYLNSYPHLVLENGEREGRNDNLLASLSAAFSPQATLTASWAYNRWKVEQDLTYSQHSGDGTTYYDAAVPYADEANTLSLALYYELRKDLTLTADLSFTITEGEYRPGYVIEGDSSALGSFTAQETTETVLSVAFTQKLSEDWEAGIEFSADIYNDKFSEDTGDNQDGELYAATLKLKRYF